MSKQTERKEESESKQKTPSKEKEILSTFGTEQAVICKGCKRIVSFLESFVQVTFPKGDFSLIRVKDGSVRGCGGTYDYAPSDILWPTERHDRKELEQDIETIKGQLEELKARLQTVETTQRSFWDDVEKAKQKLETSITKFVAEKLAESTKKSGSYTA